MRGLAKIATNAPIGAWKCNFSPFRDIMTERPTDRQTASPGQTEVTLAIKSEN